MLVELRRKRDSNTEFRKIGDLQQNRIIKPSHRYEKNSPRKYQSLQFQNRLDSSQKKLKQVKSLRQRSLLLQVPIKSPKKIRYFKFLPDNNNQKSSKQLIQLPEKYQKLKVKLMNLEKEEISRPCRHHLHNNLQLQPEQLCEKNKMGEKRKIMKKWKKLKNFSLPIGACESNYENDEKFDEDDIQGINFSPEKIQKSQDLNETLAGLPSNKNLRRRKNYNLVQSKVVQVNYVNNNLKRAKIIGGQNLETQRAEQIIAIKGQQAEKQDPKEQKNIQMVIKNPLKILNSFLRSEYTECIIQIKQQLLQTDFPLFNPQYEIPQEQQAHKFVMSYKPLNREFNVQGLTMSSAFQIKLLPAYPSEYQKTSIYFGQIKNGLYQGIGVLITKYEIKEGVWQNGLLVKGYIQNEVQTYKGDFLNGLKHGFGISYYRNGSSYQGSWSNNKRAKNGFFKFLKNQSYVGEWLEGQFCGKGVLKTNFSIYEGDFKNGMRQGHGNQVFRNGQTYEGAFQSNYPQGKGKYEWKNMFYEGTFRKGNRQGQGILKYPSFIEYEGNFKNDLPSGNGKATYNNGDVYYGLFYKGQRSGRGDLIQKSKRQIFTGDWIKDQLVYRFT